MTDGAPGAGSRIVVCLPSLGRPPRDFDHLADALGDAGFEVHAIDLGAVTDAADLHAYAATVASHVEAYCAGGPVHVVGHAFGNRVARCLAADRPDLVASVTLLAAGGRHPGDDEAHRALLRCFGGPPAPEHRVAVETAFFAPGNDPTPFLDGWDADAARWQGQAVRATDPADWWDAGSAPVLVVQGLDDRIAPPANGRELAIAHPERVTLVEIERAGHALLPEQPAAVAAAVIGFLHGRSG
jgi:pimeloyl-ACP methyl ester carboxylesterase